MQKKNTRTRGRKAIKLSAPENAAHIYRLLHDPKQSDEGRGQVIDWFLQFIDDMGIWYDSPDLFPIVFPKAARLFERGKAHDHSGATQAYDNLQAILARVEQGETLEETRRERYERMDATTAELRRRELAKPEPRNKLSAEWRYWKLRQIEHAVANREADQQGYEDAGAFIRELINGLVKCPDFWRMNFIAPMLAHFISARQGIDETYRYEKRMRAGLKGAHTRKAKKGVAR